MLHLCMIVPVEAQGFAQRAYERMRAPHAGGVSGWCTAASPIIRAHSLDPAPAARVRGLRQPNGRVRHLVCCASWSTPDFAPEPVLDSSCHAEFLRVALQRSRCCGRWLPDLHSLAERAADPMVRSIAQLVQKSPVMPWRLGPADRSQSHSAGLSDEAPVSGRASIVFFRLPEPHR